MPSGLQPRCGQEALMRTPPSRSPQWMKRKLSTAADACSSVVERTAGS
jgi:hypothetical protein